MPKSHTINMSYSPHQSIMNKVLRVCNVQHRQNGCTHLLLMISLAFAASTSHS